MPPIPTANLHVAAAAKPMLCCELRRSRRVVRSADRVSGCRDQQKRIAVRDEVEFRIERARERDTVEPQWRRRGLGRRLFVHVARLATERGGGGLN
jgi:GNAT superfamily N-acetyltransferase